MRKGEIAHDEQFLHTLHCFLKTLFDRQVKTRDCCENNVDSINAIAKKTRSKTKIPITFLHCNENGTLNENTEN